MGSLRILLSSCIGIPTKLWPNLLTTTGYETAYGDASNIPHELERLLSKDLDEAMDATHQLWCSLCHQHAYISSAAEPAYLFLKYVLEKAEGNFLVEMLDIFAGFAECSSPKHPEGEGEFQKRVRGLLQQDVELFKKLSLIEGPEGFAEYIVEEVADNA